MPASPSIRVSTTRFPSLSLRAGVKSSLSHVPHSPADDRLMGFLDAVAFARIGGIREHVSDRRSVPAFSGRACDPVAVEAARDAVGRVAGLGFAEDPPHDRRLGLRRPQLAGRQSRSRTGCGRERVGPVLCAWPCRLSCARGCACARTREWPRLLARSARLPRPRSRSRRPLRPFRRRRYEAAASRRAGSCSRGSGGQRWRPGECRTRRVLPARPG